jgi:hypothetical protein
MLLIKEYRLKGHYANRTVSLGGFQFINGLLVATFSSEDHQKLARVLSQWQAEEVKDVQHDIREEVTRGMAGDLQRGGQGPEEGSPEPDSDVPTKAPTSDPGRRLGAEGGGQEESVVAEHPRTRQVRLAVLSLDPGDDSSWVANGKPQLQAVERAAGFAGLTRSMVDAIMPGYTRAQAAIRKEEALADARAAAGDDTDT